MGKFPANKKEKSGVSWHFGTCLPYKGMFQVQGTAWAIPERGVAGWAVAAYPTTYLFFLMVMGRLKFCDLEVKVFVLNYQASELICLLNWQFLSSNFIFFLYDCISPIANSLFLLILINCFHLLFFFWLISPLRKCALQYVLNSNKFILFTHQAIIKKATSLYKEIC